MTERRKYKLKQRAQQMAETRRRIVDAAVELHGTVGPARTTINAIADLAGVQRHTVYRYFPDDDALFGACSSQFVTEFPLPDLAGWRAIEDPAGRLEKALGELFAYYARHESMLGNVLRDVELIDALKPVMQPILEYMSAAGDTLVDGWPVDDERRHLLRAAAHHAVDFFSWRSLVVPQGLTTVEAVELVSALVAAAAVGPSEVVA